MTNEAIADVRSFERLLCESGFTQREAKAITAKGFKAANLGAGASAEIAEIVQELKARQVALECKRPRGNRRDNELDLARNAVKGATSGFAQGLGQEVAREILDYVAFKRADTYLKNLEARSRQGKRAHMFTLQPGKGKSFNFPLMHESGNMTIRIRTHGDIRLDDVRFRCRLRYPEWSKNSVSFRNVDVQSSSKSISVGSHQTVQDWLVSVTTNKLAQAKSAMSGYYGPRAWVEYLGLVDRKREAPSLLFDVSLVP